MTKYCVQCYNNFINAWIDLWFFDTLEDATNAIDRSKRSSLRLVKRTEEIVSEKKTRKRVYKVTFKYTVCVATEDRDKVGRLALEAMEHADEWADYTEHNIEEILCENDLPEGSNLDSFAYEDGGYGDKTIEYILNDGRSNKHRNR